MIFHELDKKDAFLVNHPKPFMPIGKIESKDKIDSFNFAFSMAFGEGEHRDHRSGGSQKRREIDIFRDAFQGKASEFAVYRYFKKMGLEINPPDLRTFQLGIWDQTDLIIKNKNINIKSTKSFADLLLFEMRDWDAEGRYIPNIDSQNDIYDFYFLVRIDPDLSKIIIITGVIRTQEELENYLKAKVNEIEIIYDIPGYILHEDLKNVINAKHVITKGSLLNGKKNMDADNYYIQSGDLRDLVSIKEYFG